MKSLKKPFFIADIDIKSVVLYTQFDVTETFCGNFKSLVIKKGPNDMVKEYFIPP
jgi:hypothetical protein